MCRSCRSNPLSEGMPTRQPVKRMIFAIFFHFKKSFHLKNSHLKLWQRFAPWPSDESVWQCWAFGMFCFYFACAFFAFWCLYINPRGWGLFSVCFVACLYFFCEINIAKFLMLFFDNNCWCCFCCLGAFWNVFDQLLHLLRICEHYGECSAYLLCVLLRNQFFFDQSMFLICCCCVYAKNCRSRFISFARVFRNCWCLFAFA